MGILIRQNLKFIVEMISYGDSNIEMIIINVKANKIHLKKNVCYSARKIQ